MTGLTYTGKPRATPRPGHDCLQHEIEPGRAVPNNWDRWLTETWAERKARRAAEKAAVNERERG